jgi:membrane fusion protein (multidrug efflux system)
MADLTEARQQAAALLNQTNVTASIAAANGSLAAADQQSSQAQLVLSRVTLNRLEHLLAEGGISRQEVDQARATYRQALAQGIRSQASRQQAEASAGQVGADRLKAGAAIAKVQQAAAAVAEARLQLTYDRIVARQAGRIGSRQAQPGQQVEPSQPVMTLVSSHPWVEAHFKETQLEALRIGQPAEVRLDAFPGHVFRAHVESIAPASGARFALLPPDNATGNFTKVVQRITARIALDPVGGTSDDARLAGSLVPGLSATVRVRRP